MKLTEYTENRLPTYDVDLEAPPDSRWKHIAQKEAQNIGRLLDDCVALCVERASSFPLVVRPLVVAAGKGLASLGGRVIDNLAASYGQQYVTEIRSIAKHADQPLSHVMLGNLTYDMCQMAGIHGLGCSSYSCNIDGRPVLVRNMDWVWPRSTGRIREDVVLRFHQRKVCAQPLGHLCDGIAVDIEPRTSGCPGFRELGKKDVTTGLEGGEQIREIARDVGFVE